MIKPGKIVFIGDEYLEIIALAAGVDAYVFNNDCRKLEEWITKNIQLYDVIVYLDTVSSTCSDVIDHAKSIARDKIFLMLEHPLLSVQRDPRDYYRELARKILGIEITLN
ncbi:MAG: hypothetical protein QXJ69_01925 [Desulfurococcaceae archaeon]